MRDFIYLYKAVGINKNKQAFLEIQGYKNDHLLFPSAAGITNGLTILDMVILSHLTYIIDI